MNCKNVWAENYNKSALVTFEWVEIGFVHEIIKELVLITFKGAKIDEIHFPLYGGSPCI